MKSEMFAIPIMNGLKRISEEVVEVGSVREFKGRLNIEWLEEFGSDSV